VSYYPNLESKNIDFEEGFYDGIAFCYILHWYSPEHVKLDRVSKVSSSSSVYEFIILTGVYYSMILTVICNKLLKSHLNNTMYLM
jgi:hypothetical protein